jgi:hypothetical protein
MEKIIAIRIEHPETSWGIFCSDNIWENLRIDYFSTTWYEKHEEMEMAINIEGWTEKHFCAYKSIKNLKYWLNSEDIAQILSVGFIIYELELSDAIISSDQILYRKEDIISQIDITKQFK